jgi:Putative adhesin
MRNAAATLCLLAGVLASAGCDHAHARSSSKSAAKKTLTINKSWPAAGIQNIRVAEVDGSITVEAAKTTEITLEAVAEGDLELKPGQENQGLFQTAVEGDTLRIGREHRENRKFRISFLWDDDDMRIRYTLKVPATVSLDMNTVNGRIATRGIEGATEATSVNGTIDVEVAGINDLEATTVNGRVKATFTKSFQGAKFRTVNGGVEAVLPQQASFTVDLAQVNGDFEASFPLSIHSHPGRRRVSGEVNGGQHELKITTVNGDVELARLGAN